MLDRPEDSTFNFMQKLVTPRLKRELVKWKRN